MRFSALVLSKLLTLLALCALVGTACGSSQSVDEEAETAPRAERLRYGNLDRALFNASQQDINQDGQPDQIEYRRAGMVVFIERDLDFDGRPDLVEYFDASGALVEQEFQLDYDTSVDAVRFYVDGVVHEKRISTVHDGSVTMWKYYTLDGVISRIERDTDQSGAPDEWEFYEDGRLSRIERDTDGDGVPDTQPL